MMKMNKTSPIVGAVLCFCSFAGVSVLLAGAQQHRRRKITDAEVKAVIQAVEDEIYDRGYEKEYGDVDVPPACGPRRSATCIRIYINPEIDADGTGGEVIYKLMPYGEVFRDHGILDSKGGSAGKPKSRVRTSQLKGTGLQMPPLRLRR